MAAQQVGLLQLQEQFALYQHIQTYHWLADTWNWEEMAKLFSEDTVYEFEAAKSEGDQSGTVQLLDQATVGPAAVIAMFDGLVKPFKKAQHVIVNTNFQISGKTATGTANILFWGVPDPTKAHLSYSMGSRYQWKFRKEGGISPAGSTWKTTYTKVEKIWENSTLG